MRDGNRPAGVFGCPVWCGLPVPGEDRAGSERGQGLGKQAPFHSQEARAWPLGALFFQEEFSFAAFRLVSFPSGSLEQGYTLQASWALLRGQNNSPQFTGEDPVAQGHTEVKCGGVSSPYLGIPDPCLLHIHAGPIEASRTFSLWED